MKGRSFLCWKRLFIFLQRKKDEKNQTFKHLIFAAMAMINVQVYSQTINWQESEYQFHHGDFNGDGITDMLLIPLTMGEAPSLVMGSLALNSKYAPENQVYLSTHINDQPIYSSGVTFVVSDFTNDGYDDVLFTFSEYENAFLITGNEATLDFDNPYKFYTAKDLEWLTYNTELLTGDFNGDKKADLLTILPEDGHYFISYGESSGEFRVTEFKKSLFKWEGTDTPNIMVSDVNGDNRDDVIMPHKKADGKPYIALSDESGSFHKPVALKDKIQGKDWNSNDFSWILTDANNDKVNDIVRLNNAPGGINERGEIIDSEMGDDVDDPSNFCDQRFLSVNKNDEGMTCSPWREQNNINNKQTDFIAHAYQASIQNDDCPPEEPCFYPPPATPTIAPTPVGGSYHVVGSTITVNVSSIEGADWYEYYWSTYDGGYTRVSTTAGTAGNITLRSDWGYNYIKYKACNDKGCSGLSPWRRVQSYDSPLQAFPSASPSSININGSSTVSWPNPGHILWEGTHYERYYKKPSGSTVSLSNIGHTSGDTATSFTTPTMSDVGTYTYYVRACNPNVACGPWGSTTVTVNPPVPATPTITVPSSDNDGTYTVSWSSVPYATQYQLSGENSGTLYSGSALSRSRTNSNGTYSYQVRACNATGCSAVSASQSVTVTIPSGNDVTQFEFDARGRLIKVTDNSNIEVVYMLDDAGNRTSVADTTVTPLITSFIAPDVEKSGDFSTISWTATNASHCTLSIFGDISGYEYLEPISSQSIQITENTGVSLKCYAGEQYASAGKIIKIGTGSLN